MRNKYQMSDLSQEEYETVMKMRAGMMAKNMGVSIEDSMIGPQLPVEDEPWVPPMTSAPATEHGLRTIAARAQDVVRALIILKRAEAELEHALHSAGYGTR